MRGETARPFLALIAGLAAGLALASAGGEAARLALAVAEPVGTLWVNAIRMTVIPLIVASLVVAVAGAGARTVGRLGTRAFIVFFLLLSVTALFTALTAPALFERLTIDPAAAAAIRGAAAPVTRPELPTFSSWLVGLVPVNPVKAAADGAMLPLVVFTLAFGLALGRAEQRGRESVTNAFAAIASAMTVLVRWILSLAPIGVFALAVSLALRVGSGVVGAVGFYLAVHCALMTCAVLLMYAAVGIGAPSRFARFVRAAVPAQVVAVTSRSSMAALPAMLTAATSRLGLSAPAASFTLPLAVSVFRLNQAVSWLVMALFAAKLYGVPFESAQVLTISVTSVLMSFTVPGIPSGSLFVVAPFFAGVGIPPECVGVLIAVDLVPDVFKTFGNVTGQLAAATLVARDEFEATAAIEPPDAIVGTPIA